ncbi:MAG: thiamine-phosphate kinase [Candidatus Cyclobacteriaceae bacterium M2_1C_046]
MEKRTELGEVGEFGLIERLGKNFAQLNHKSSLKGIGDDAAVIKANDQEALVITSDMLIEGIHFDLSYMPLPHLGYKAVAVNISDIAAMNALPEQIIVSIGLSNRFSVEAVEAMYEGIEAACKQYNVDLIGGDTTSSSSGLVISITAVGRVHQDKLSYRTGAKPNDILCVTGDLGAAYIGLQVLEREKQVFMANPEMQPQLDKYEYIVGRQLRPEARMDIIHELRDNQIVPTSMIDISDGLASEIIHLSRNSGVGFKIYEDKLPLDKQTYDTAVEFKVGPTTAAMNGGEDYELLFTINQEDFEKLKKHPDIHFIGHVQEEKENILISKEGNVHPVQAQGWNHFKKG